MERLFHTFSILAHFRLLSDSMTNSKPLRRRVRCEKCALTANLIKGEFETTVATVIISCHFSMWQMTATGLKAIFDGI